MAVQTKVVFHNSYKIKNQVPIRFLKLQKKNLQRHTISTLLYSSRPILILKTRKSHMVASYREVYILVLKRSM